MAFLRPVLFLRAGDLRAVDFLRPVVFFRPVDLRAVDLRPVDFLAAGLRAVLRLALFFLPVVFLAANPGTSVLPRRSFLRLRLVLFGRAP